MSLKQQYEDYIARVRALGGAITNYECPDCGAALETRASPEGESWDTLSTCPHCEALHMKFTNGGSTHGEALPA